MTAQTSIFDFSPIVRDPTPKRRIQLKDQYEKDGILRAYRTDAKSFVDSIGQLPDGKALSDTRFLTNHYHGGMCNHFFHAGDGPDQDRPYYSFLQMMGKVHKEIKDKDDVIDVLTLSEYDPIKHSYSYEYKQIESAWMDSELVHIDTDKGDGYDILLEDDFECDPYRVTEFDPSYYTEHFCIEALRHGASCEDVSFIHSNYSYALDHYSPFTRDWKTGYTVRSELYAHIMGMAERYGIHVQESYDVPKPEPPQWDILPVYLKKYCYFAKGCQKAKETCGCTCCERFLYNRAEVKPEHLDKPDRKRAKHDYDEDEEEEEE